MATAKDIVLKPISSKDANALVRRVHYSGKVVNNSQLHIGVFLHGQLEGAMQFGPSLDKRKIQGLVSGTLWHEFIELNRMAFSDRLPRNSESRALSIAMKLIKKYAPQVKWVVTFADGTQCGDGTIYRAAGFVLTGIRENKTIGTLDGKVISDFTLQKGKHILQNNGKASAPIDFELLNGFQLRYIYFVDPTCRARLAVPELPYSDIERLGAGMYKGQKRASEVTPGDTTDDQLVEGGSSPTRTL